VAVSRGHVVKGATPTYVRHARPGERETRLWVLELRS